MTPATWASVGSFALYGVAVVAGSVIVTVGAGRWLRRDSRSRNRHLATLARSMEGAVAGEVSGRLEQMGFALFDEGHADPRVHHAIEGVWKGLPVEQIDLEYRSKVAQAPDEALWLSCAFSSVDRELPHLLVQRRRVYLRVDLPGLPDPVEMGIPEFDRAFAVHCSEPNMARLVLDEAMMRWLVTTEKLWSFEVHCNHLMAWSRRLRPAELPLLLDALEGFHRRIPQAGSR